VDIIYRHLRWSFGKLSYSYLAVDIHDNVLVLDRGNNRVQLLSPTLTYLGDIEIPGHQLKDPDAVYFDELNHRLYIGETGGRRLFVVRCGQQ